MTKDPFVAAIMEKFRDNSIVAIHAILLGMGIPEDEVDELIEEIQAAEEHHRDW